MTTKQDAIDQLFEAVETLIESHAIKSTISNFDEVTPTQQDACNAYAQAKLDFKEAVAILVDVEYYN